MRKLGLVLLSAVGLVGCAVEDYVTDNNSSVLFLIADINGGVPLTSDVVTDTGSVVADLAPVTLAVRPKNANFDTVPQVPMAVLVQRYEIRYYRSDGRATQGVDVPYSISGNLTTAVDAGIGSGQNVTLDMEVVRAQAKLEPPLRNLVGGGQAIMISIFAEVTMHGRTVAGEAVKAVGTLQVNFADFVGTT
jgi:hypothetical protein